MDLKKTTTENNHRQPYRASSLIKYLIITSIVLSLVLVGMIIYSKVFDSYSNTESYYEDDYEYDTSYEEYDVPTDTKEPESTYVNQDPVSLSKVQELINKYGEYTAALSPDTITFNKTQNYKGIKIAWTNGAPISAERIQWLKDVIDNLPASFLAKYPITGFYSAEREDYPDSFYSISNASAFASGTNIFLTPIMADTYMPTLYEQLSKKQFATVIYHEWAHVIQFYDVFYTFKEGYLDYNFELGNSIGAMFFQSANIVYDFANRAGWVYSYTDLNKCYEYGFCLNGFSYCPRYYGNMASKPENPDSTFLKTSEYALDSYTSGGVEDMAETFAYFVTCDESVVFSQARIDWAEDFLGKSQEYYCSNSKF